MAFAVPNFNLAINVWDNQGNVFVPVGPPDRSGTAQLRALFTANGVNSISASDGLMVLCLPRGFDVMGRSGFGGIVCPHGDLVECPAGSGRIYQVEMVDDVAKGFANEYRFAVIKEFPLSFRPIP